MTVQKKVYLLVDIDLDSSRVVGAFTSKEKLDKFLEKFPGGNDSDSNLVTEEHLLDPFENEADPPADRCLYEVWHMNKDGEFPHGYDRVEELPFFVGWEKRVGRIEKGTEWDLAGRKAVIAGHTLNTTVLATDEQNAIEEANKIRLMLIQGGQWDENRRIKL